MSLESLNAKFGKKKGFVVGQMRKHGPSTRARVQEPAPGYGKPVKIPKVIKSLLDSITDDDIDRVAKAWREALEATTEYYDIKKKKMVVRPDHNTRMKAGQLIAAYREGLPVQRQLTLAGKFKDLTEMLAQLNGSPQGQQLLAELPAIDVESSVQETGAQSDADPSSETAKESEQS